jgi:hypothetical protein
MQQPGGASYAEQFKALSFDNPGGAVSANDIPSNTSSGKMLEDERNLALAENWSPVTGEMTYGVASSGELDKFRREKLVPSFKKGSYGGTVDRKRHDGNMQTRLDLFTGASAVRPGKVEARERFQPVKNLTNIWGSPNVTEYELDRFALNDRRNNEKPFEQVRVTPGLDMDYNQNADGEIAPGYSYRPLPKTVDDLRQANRQKVSYAGVMVPGFKGERRGVQADMIKNRPYRAFEQKAEDMQRTGGYIKAPTLRDNFEAKTTLKQQQLVHYAGPTVGPAGDVAAAVPEGMRSKIKESQRQRLASGGLRNGGTTDGGHAMRANWQISDNERVSTSHTRHLQHAAEAQAAGFVVDPNDVPDPTKRQMHMYDETSKWGRIADGAAALGAVPLTDQMRTTGRQLIEDARQSGAVRGEAMGQAWNPEDRPDTTLRQTTENTRWLQTARGPVSQTHSYNPNHRPDTTLRETTEVAKYLAPVVQALAAGTVHWNQLPATLKEQLIQNERAGTLTGSALMGHVYNPDDVPDTTLREMMENARRVQSAAAENHTGYQSQTVVAPTTMRQVTGPNRYIGAQGAGYTDGGAYQSNIYSAPTTLREGTERTDHIGHAATTRDGGYQAANVVAKTTHRQTTESTKHLQGGRIEHHQGAYQSNRYIAPDTLRQLTENSKRVAGGADAGHTGYQSNPHVAKTTQRQTTEISKRVGGQADTNHGNGHTGYQSNPMEAKTTLRQIHERADRAGGVAVAGPKTGGYHTERPDAKTTLRQIHEQADRAGGVAVAGPKTGGYHTERPDAKTTMRQIHERADRAGGVAVAGPKTGGYHAERMDAKTTMRQIHERADRAGGVEVSGPKSGGYQNEKMIAETTLREMIENAERSGALHVGDQTGYQSAKTVAKPTLRQGTINVKRMGGHGTAAGQNAYESNPMTAGPTIRQGTTNVFYRGTAGAQEEKGHTVYQAYYNEEFNPRHEMAEQGRAPTAYGGNQGPTMAFTETRLPNMLNAVREPAADDSYNPHGRMGDGMVTRGGTRLPQESTRLDIGLNTAMNSNPYNIPLVHFPVETGRYTGYEDFADENQ